MTNTIAAYKDLSSVEEWVKHYCQRKTAVRFFENGSAYGKEDASESFTS